MRPVYVCQHEGCGRSYVNNSILKRHLQAFHTTEKRFQCHFCGKCLASMQNLKEHSYIHTGEKPYRCPYPGCTSTFRQGTHLSAHKKLEHSEGQSSNLTPITTNLQMGLNYLTRLISKRENSNISLLPADCQEIKFSPITLPYTCCIPNLFS